jgi:hypothetical protein
MEGQFPRNEFEALIGHLKQWLAGANDPDGEETLLLSEVDEVFIEMGQLCADVPTAAQMLEKPVDRWAELRTNEAPDETLINELELIVYDLENLSDEFEQESSNLDEFARRRQERSPAPSRGLFDAGLQSLLGKLAALPDRGVLNQARLKKLAESKKAK